MEVEGEAEASALEVADEKLEAKLADDGEVSEALEALGQATGCQVPTVAVGEATGNRGVHGRAG